MKVKIENFGGVIPFRTTPNSAGYDLFSFVSGKIVPGDRVLVNTGIAIALPENSYGHICPRSSLALKGIDIGAGVIDADYTGVIKVLLINNSKEDFFFKAGERIAQLIIEQIMHLEPYEVKKLPKTKRGNQGFGSTGK